MRSAGALCLMVAVVSTAASAVRAQPAQRVAKPVSRAVQEARFLRTVDRQKTANLVTGDLALYAGSHVDYTCEVETIVRSGVILGQCGSDAEPVDLFVKLQTAHLRIGERLRVLGVMEEPASWADVMGHTVYYAFLRAVFVDRVQ